MHMHQEQLPRIDPQKKLLSLGVFLGMMLSRARLASYALEE